MIGSYNDLKAQLTVWLKRSGQTSKYDTAATLAEARIFRDLARIGAGETVATTLVANAEKIDLPADWNGARLLALDGASRTDEIIYLAPQRLWVEYPSLSLGQPRAYTVMGKGGAVSALQAWFRPIPDGAYNLRCIYYRKPSSIVDAGGTLSNWISVDHFDVYLYATLIEMCGLLEDPTNLQTWVTGYGTAIDAIETIDRDKRWPGPLRIRPGVRLMRGN